MKKAKLGEGTHGSVFMLDDERVVKRTKIVDQRDYGTYLSDGLVPELAAIERVSNTCCRHIVRTLDWKCVKESGVVYSETTLERLVPLDTLDSEQLSSSAPTYIRHIFESLADLHQEDIAHCDLKLDNVMWRWGDDEIALIDFGLSKLDGDIKPPDKALFTFDYRSPEGYLLVPRVDLKKADVWSAGVCAVSIMLGRGKRSVYYNKMYDLGWRGSLDVIVSSIGGDLPPYSGLARYQAYAQWRAAKPLSVRPGYLLRKIASQVGDEAADFVRKVMDLNPSTRMTARQALEHPYLARVMESPRPPRNSPFPIRNPEEGAPVDLQSINEIVAACLNQKLSPETAFKTFDVLSAIPADEARDPKTVAAVIMVASSMGESRLINAEDLFTVVAPWVKGAEMHSQVCRVMKHPGVISLLAAPSVLRMARVLDQNIRGTKEEPVVRKLLNRYVEKGGKRPTVTDILECVK